MMVGTSSVKMNIRWIFRRCIGFGLSDTNSLNSNDFVEDSFFFTLFLEGALSVLIDCYLYCTVRQLTNHNVIQDRFFLHFYAKLHCFVCQHRVLTLSADRKLWSTTYFLATSISSAKYSEFWIFISRQTPDSDARPWVKPFMTVAKCTCIAYHHVVKRGKVLISLGDAQNNQVTMR